MHQVEFSIRDGHIKYRLHSQSWRMMFWATLQMFYGMGQKDLNILV